MSAGKPQILIPFDAREAISVASAASIARVSDDTIRRWADLENLGRRIGGRWVLSRIALAMYLDGDRRALAAYLVGDRTSSQVARYIELVEKTKITAAKTAKTASAAA